MSLEGYEPEPVGPVAVSQPGHEREVTIQFSQQSRQEAVSQGPPPEQPLAPLAEPCSVIPLGPPVEEPPRFTMPLRNQTVNDADRVLFRVFYRGYPAPTVTWYFNSQPVRPSQDFKIHVDVNRGESTLIIVEVFPEDEGEYMCKAENQYGTAITHCHLFVRRESLITKVFCVE